MPFDGGHRNMLCADAAAVQRLPWSCSNEFKHYPCVHCCTHSKFMKSSWLARGAAACIYDLHLPCSSTAVHNREGITTLVKVGVDATWQHPDAKKSRQGGWGAWACTRKAGCHVPCGSPKIEVQHTHQPRQSIRLCGHFVLMIARHGCMCSR